jgi:hypothetical protein
LLGLECEALPVRYPLDPGEFFFDGFHVLSSWILMVSAYYRNNIKMPPKEARLLRPLY